MATRLTGISVLTIVKDRPDHLRRVIEGLERSHVAPDELIIVDMGSSPADSDGSDAFAVRIIPLDQPGLPLARARNLAAAHATSPYLLFLDVDCIPSADLIAAMVELLANPAAVFSANVRYLHPGAVSDGWTEDRLRAASTRHPVRSFPVKGVRREYNYGLFWSLAFGMSAELYRSLGGFDERFTGYGAEDTDFGFRMKEAGVPLFMVGGEGAYHQSHAVYDPPLQHFEDIVRNAELFKTRWGSWPMADWLDAFEKRGLMKRVGDRIDLRRMPTSDEIAAARVEAAFA